MDNEELRKAAEYVRDNDGEWLGANDGGTYPMPDSDFIEHAKVLAAAMLARLDGKEDFYDGGGP
jgi:hypothetical protein